MKHRLRFAAITLMGTIWTLTVRAQDLVGDTPVKPASKPPVKTVDNGDFFQHLVTSYTGWDVFKVGWFLATVVFAYGVATLFFKLFLNDRNATTAGKMGCFFGALGFLGINLVTFGLFFYRDHPTFGWMLTVILVALVFALLYVRPRERA